MAIPAILSSLAQGAATGAVEGNAAGGLADSAQSIGMKSPMDAIKKLESFGNDVKDHFTRPLEMTGKHVREFERALFAWEQPLKAVQGLFQHMGQYTSKFNPYYMEKFNLATDDLMATIGEALVPVLEDGTALMRGFADATADLLPLLKDGVNLAQNVGKYTGKLIMGEQGTFALQQYFSSIEGKSVGKSFQPAQATNVQSMLTQLQTRAFSAGGGKSPEQTTADNTSIIVNTLLGMFGVAGSSSAANVYNK